MAALLSTVLTTPSPPIPPSQFYTLSSTLSSGRTLTSSVPIPPNTLLLTSGPPIVSTPVRKYKKDVCAQCLKFEEMEKGWKEVLRLSLGEAGKGKEMEKAVRWFCGGECRAVWEERMGKLGLDIVRTGERVVERAEKDEREKEKKESASTRYPTPSTSTTPCPPALSSSSPPPFSNSDFETSISTSWNSSISLASHLLLLRLQSHQSPKSKSLSRRLVLCSPSALDPVSDDVDLVQFLTDGIARRYTGTLGERREWDQSIRGLVPSLEIYKDGKREEADGKRNLDSHRKIYFQFVRELPLAVLLPLPHAQEENEEKTTTEAAFELASVILSIVTRDCGNSFGLREGDHSDPQSNSPSVPPRGPLLAYGIYPPASLFNHSCAPNVIKTRSSSGAGEWNFTTTNEETPANVELCISYLGGEEERMRRGERREELFKGWGFWCGCRRCKLEEGMEGNG